MLIKPMNKKGVAGLFLNIFMFMIIGFIVVFISVIFIYVSAQIDDNLKTTFTTMDQNNETSGERNLTTIQTETFHNVTIQLTSLRWISSFLLLGMVFAMFIASYLVTVRPIFFVPYIFMTIIAIVVSAAMANAYNRMVQEATLASTFTQLPGSNFIFANLPIWVTVIGFIGGAIMLIQMQTRRTNIV
jgi:hypothetical protein